ncbi:MAG: hypothetical protein JWO05_3305 [Gemmatimonadetes bacterium]|nr:hypothetical protein [Gemmatimonadota bacterium]
MVNQRNAARYVQPLREGGSLPAVVETDEGELYVVKFRGAGQGANALIAELVVGELARTLGLPMPGLAIVDIADAFGRSEPDPEIQEILQKSRGTNVGMRYMDGAFNFSSSAAGELVDDALATRIVWFDALVTNPDRSARNPNMMVWQRQPWLIDHGAALYAHHDWRSVDEARAKTPFTYIKDHVLIARQGDIAAADAELAPMLDENALRAAMASVPDSLLLDPVTNAGFDSAEAARERYVGYLVTRLESPRAWVDEAVAARARALVAPPLRVSSRR